MILEVNMPKTMFGIRIETDALEKLKKKAEKENMTPSAYAAKLLEEAMSEQQRIDLAVAKINEECLQIEGMLSIMQGFNKKVFATLLGRTEVSLPTAEARAEAVEKKQRAMEGIEKFLNEVGRTVADGENVWGVINEGE